MRAQLLNRLPLNLITPHEHQAGQISTHADLQSLQETYIAASNSLKRKSFFNQPEAKRVKVSYSQTQPTPEQPNALRVVLPPGGFQAGTHFAIESPNRNSSYSTNFGQHYNLQSTQPSPVTQMLTVPPTPYFYEQPELSPTMPVFTVPVAPTFDLTVSNSNIFNPPNSYNQTWQFNFTMTNQQFTPQNSFSNSNHGNYQYIGLFNENNPNNHNHNLQNENSNSKKF